jgi:hypothetical protein
MQRLSRRDTVLVFGFVVPLSTAIITFVVGPRYLQPLPTWAKLAFVAAGCCFIAAVAIYGRRRARRTVPTSST